ncbi:GNAT family N-acetyltransferase [Halobacteriales archaeon Cl-PHB]
MPGPRIATHETVSLRTVETEDAAFLQRAFTDPEIRIPLGSPPPKNRAAIEDSIEETAEDRNQIRFVACLDGRDAGPGTPDEDAVTPIGTVGLEDFTWKRAELGYWLVPEFHGEGYGKVAVALAVEYAFQTFGVSGVSADAYAFNDASQGLLESLGFEQEGRRRKQRFVGGRFVDTLEFGLLREEWGGVDEL